mmetsp:Transcript_20001/g.23687  ORF Transcript_20001/g.23687 Transcript_20001/m.23687 type:complete len:220 (+) Transcript_20001:237-896(+)
MPKPMLIKKDSHGETHIEEVKEDHSQTLTIERVRELTRLDPDRDSTTLKGLATHEKLIWLKMKIDREAPSITAGASKITVSRENLLADSLAAFKGLKDKKKLLQVTFENEVSRDVGGISREFFSTLMKELIQESFGLFSVANTEQFSYRIAPDSYEIGGHVELYHFFGQLLGKAIFDRIPLNLCLSRSIFNALLGKVSPEDYAEIRKFKHVDTEMASSL